MVKSTLEQLQKSVESELYAKPRDVDSLEVCSFYQTTDVPGVGTVEALWDLREGSDQYFGNLDFANKRVLEIGPANGFMTFTMEKRGAEVVCVELSCTDDTWDCVPHESVDVVSLLRAHEAGLDRVKNAFWFCHKRFGSRAKVHYGSAYHLPNEFGFFDAAVLGCVLLHCRSPVAILQECARLVRGSIAVTEISYRELAGMPLSRLHSNTTNRTWHTWWDFSPEFFLEYLKILGFTDGAVTYHEHFSKEYGRPVELFTVVSHRRAS